MLGMWREVVSLILIGGGMSKYDLIALGRAIEDMEIMVISPIRERPELVELVELIMDSYDLPLPDIRPIETHEDRQPFYRHLEKKRTRKTKR